ncbi:MAG: helix-turn-helix domain-containing protein [Segetibacter sp.]
MKNCSDEFLLEHLVKSKANDPYNSITSASALLFLNPNINIKKLAYEANMCLKSFELKFACQVGLPPKLFARITRFNYALLLKTQNVLKNWTDIAHKCGYYDQMHFIKEFKQFAGDTPVNFYKETPLPRENYIHSMEE